MNSVLGSSIFKASVLLLPFVFAACTTEETEWFERSDDYGPVLYERHLKKGSSASFDCYVKSLGDHVTLEMIYDLSMYDANLNVIYDVEAGDPSYYYVDVMMTGVFQGESQDACESIQESIEGIETSCSNSRVRGKAELGSVNEFSKSLVLGNMVPSFKSQCDEFYDTYKDMMSEIPGKWSYGDAEPSVPAQICDVNLTADALYMNVDYPTRSMAMEVTHYSINGTPVGSFRIAEAYAGVPADTLAMICSAYRQESDISGVYCEGSTISYLVPEMQDGKILTLEDMAVVYKKEVCPGLLDGSLSMEDLWFND